MKNKKPYFLKAITSIIFCIGIILMMFENTLYSGATILFIGFFLAVSAIQNKTKAKFNDTFMYISAVLALIILAYTLFLNYSKNIIIISVSFYALKFLIQINNIKKEKTITKTKKREDIKKAIKELKKEINTNKTYQYAQTGKSFHVAGCIALSRTKKENIKTSTSREELIEKGYKTCKVCNS